MCGRYVLVTPVDELADYFSAAVSPGVAEQFGPSWNIPPTRNVLAVAAEGEGDARTIDQYRWGLVPSWAKDLAMSSRTFNARAETVATKPTFRAAFSARRLIVPADGFYEWSTAPGDHKQPYLFSRRDGAVLAFAGLWEVWRDRRDGVPDAWLRSCTIITTVAGSDVAGVHERQPVVLEPSAWATWLDPGGAERGELESLLVSSPAGTLERRAVPGAVGDVGDDGPSLLARTPPVGGG